MKKLVKITSLLAMSVLGLNIAVSIAAYGLSIPSAPPLDRPIIDQTGTFSSTQINDLSAQIKTGRSKKSYQIGVLMMPSLNGRDIESYSIEVARSWGIGEKGKNNGVLLLIAKNDHQLRIEVGSGLEGDLTDAESGRIIRNVITPKFKVDDFYGGVSAGLTSIQAQVEGRADPSSKESAADIGQSIQDTVETWFFVIVGGFGVISWIGSMLARSKSWWAGGTIGGVMGFIIVAAAGWSLLNIFVTIVMIAIGLLFDWLVSRNYRIRTSQGLDPSWWAGGSSSGSGGGGGSFGGGGFSGGGASGSW